MTTKSKSYNLILGINATERAALESQLVTALPALEDNPQMVEDWLQATAINLLTDHVRGMAREVEARRERDAANARAQAAEAALMSTLPTRPDPLADMDSDDTPGSGDPPDPLMP